VLGLGVGIHEGEYARAGVDYHRRGRLMDEGIAALHAAWDNEAASDYLMHPAADPVPLWIGGSSPAARRRAASVGDGWIPLFLTPEEYGPALAELRRETADAGRDPESVAAGVVMFAYVDDDPAGPERGAEWLSRLYRLPPKAFRRHLVAGSPQTCADALERYAEAGARHILIMVAGSPAVRHFALLHAEYTGRPERVLVEAPA
jgi:alkanesulfonate monooxygenase SsuD/methylene tetrahydromethanopterin reductase-like flavin-dependent oxidoreductase (luciferase family)